MIAKNPRELHKSNRVSLPHLTETKLLAHTMMLLQQFMMSSSPSIQIISDHRSLSGLFFSVIFPWLPEGTSLLKWIAVFAQGRVGLSCGPEWLFLAAVDL